MSATRIILLVLAICIGIAVFANKMDVFKRKAVAPASAAMPAAQVMPPLAAWTPAQRKAAESLARELCEALSNSDGKTVEKLQNLDGMIKRAMVGFELPGLGNQQIIDGMKQGIRGQSGAILAESVGSEASFLRLTDIHQQGSALCRVLAGGGISLIYIIPDFSGPAAKILDIYVMATGAFVSESIRDVMIPMVGSMNRSNSEANTLVKGMESVNAAKASGDGERLLAAVKALPPSFRERPTIRSLYLQCLMSREDTTEYQKELERIQREDAGNPTTTFKLLDLHILKKDWKAAADAGSELSQVIGGDCYLDAMTGMCLAYDGRYEEAEKLFDAAEQAEPELTSVLIYRIHLDCARKDYAGVVKTLDRLKQKGMQPTLQEMVAQFPAVQTFLESAEYKAWQEAQ